MFVTSVLDEWWKKFGRPNDRHLVEWEKFVQQQQKVWTPREISDRCCIRWLAHGQRSGHHNMTASSEQYHHRHHGPTTIMNEQELLACPGGCYKLHPCITLHFDEVENCSIAVVSHPLDPFERYFEKLVDYGIATRKTPFYFKLQGYLRENFCRLRKADETGFGSHLVHIAVGALAKSDHAQKVELESAITTKRNAQHATSSTTPARLSPSYRQLEDVFEIIRLHRLGDDLDIMSIFCLRLVNKGIGNIAAKMARERIQSAKIIANPLVDGCSLSGFSVFRRRRRRPVTPLMPQQQQQQQQFPTMVVQDEHKKLIEYSESNKIYLSAATSGCNHYNGNGNDDQSCGTVTFRPSITSPKDFSWNCEE